MKKLYCGNADEDIYREFQNRVVKKLKDSQEGLLDFCYLSEEDTEESRRAQEIYGKLSKDYESLLKNIDDLIQWGNKKIGRI